MSDKEAQSHNAFLVAENTKFRAVIERIKLYAPYDIEILLLGETGVGKDYLARRVHELSGRKGEFVLVNCPSVPNDMFESEFFGHEKGAFTGALKYHKGFFEQADKGTLFLNEIGKTHLWYQAKLLTVVETKKIRPVGSDREIKVDVRLVTASNVDLMMLVKSKKFLEDFYYRIAEVPIQVPPLRERLHEIVPLARHFVELFAGEFNRPVPALDYRAIAALLSFHWTGNIRQLKTVIKRAVIEATDETITEDLIAKLLKTSNSLCLSLPDRVRNFEEELVRSALDQSTSNTEAADKLRIKKRRLKSVMKRLGIFPRRIRALAKHKKSS